MQVWILVLGWAGFFVPGLVGTAFILTSVFERRRRAAVIAAVILAPVLAAFGVLLLWDFALRTPIILILPVLLLALSLLLMLPMGAVSHMRVVQTPERVDERDIIFSRFYRLTPGSAEFEEYYRRHPEKLQLDESIRAMPQICQPGTKTYHPFASLFGAAAFGTVGQMARQIDSESAASEAHRIEASAEEFTARIKGFAHYLGAVSVGTTKLNPAYVYSHVGRSAGRWGELIALDHTNAIAVAVEMEYDMVRYSPDNPTITESASKYLEAAKVAVTLARYINLLGYKARAHIDANYRLMCVPVAVDAGLGELGRLGLLITPQFGPRVRLAVVTTNLPLVYDKPIHFGVQDFCAVCKKCATNCPSAAIPVGRKAISNGVEKWPLNTESCYRFWRKQGTDCGICMRVCPYSHPDNLVHNLIRRMVRRNSFARRLGVFSDDCFYGRRPKNHVPLPIWHA